MKVNEIEELLVRYYDGETNEAEEKELKEFFAQADVPAHLLAEKRLFMQLASQPEPETPEGLESKLSGLIDEWDTHERRSTKIKKHTRIIHLQWVGSIAASLLILFSVGMYLYKPYTPPTPQDTCSSPTEAYAEAQKALFMFSSALNKGVQQMETVHETTEKVQKNVNQQLKRFKNLRQLNVHILLPCYCPFAHYSLMRKSLFLTSMPTWKALRPYIYPRRCSA